MSDAFKELLGRVAQLENHVRALMADPYSAPARKADEDLRRSIDRSSKEWIVAPLDVFDVEGSSAAVLALALLKASNLSDVASASASRANLGLVIGTDVEAHDPTLTAFAGLTIAANSITIGTGADAFSQTTFGANTFPGRSSSGNLVAKAMTDFGFSLVDDADAAAGRTTLGLGSMAVQSANSVTITGGSISGITDLAIADGGTGASTAATARAALGLAIGTDVNAYIAPNTGWAMSNVTSDKVLDANSTSLDELADVVGTLVNALIAQNILGA